MHSFVTNGVGETPLTPQPAEVRNAMGATASPSAPPTPSGHFAAFDLGLALNCEGIIAELGIEKWVLGLSVSREVGVDNKGDFTAFVAPKAAAKLGVGIAEFSGAAKTGAFVSGNHNGVKDGGVKYEVKARGVVGPASAAQKIGEGKLGFVSAPTAPDGGFEPLIIGERR